MRPSRTLTTVSVRFAEQGFHCWPEAHELRDYLRARHRHLFIVTVEAKVDHHERMIEFHDLLDLARSTWPVALATKVGREAYHGEYGRLSCETMALLLGEHLWAAEIPVVSVTVSEDGEVSSTVTWSQEV